MSALTQSERQILGLMSRQGALTQGEIAKATELTQQSVSRILAALSKAGMIIAGETKAEGRRGYPSTAKKLASEFTYAVGLSLMSDAVAFALMDFAGDVKLLRHRRFTSMRIAGVLDWVQQTLTEIRATMGIGPRSICGIGVAVAGSFIESGGFNTLYALEDWAGKDVAALFCERFGLPAWSDNDGNAAATAENVLGVGKWARSFAYIYISAGVGGGVVLDGKLWRGRFGNAGEFAGGLPPNIYPFPNLELLRQLVIRDQGREIETIDDLIADFDPNWAGNDEWISKTRDSLSVIASNATAILDLDAIVLGGRLPRPLAERVIPNIVLFDQRRRSVGRPMAKIVAAEVGQDSSAIGAALLPLQNQFFA